MPKIPLCIPYTGQEEIDAVSEVIESGWYAHGPKNHEFEEGFAEFLGVKHAFSMNSCTSFQDTFSTGQSVPQLLKYDGLFPITSFHWP